MTRSGDKEVIAITIEQMKLLLGDRLAPLTTSMGFIQGDCVSVANKFIEWRKELKRRDHFIRKITHRKVSGNLEGVLRSLLPFKMISATRYLFVPTNGEWTAFFDNRYRGTDPTAISYLPELLQSRSVWVVAKPHTLQSIGTSWRGRQGALIIEVSGHEQREWLNLIRKIRLENDMGKWHFETFGEPFAFEETQRYQAKRVRDRFDFDLLKQYLAELGLFPFEEMFYLPPSKSNAILVKTRTKKMWKNKNVSFEEARRLNGIED